MLLLLFMTMFCGSLCVNLIPDYIMQNGILGDCDATVTDQEDAYIRSHTGAYQLGSAISYNENENCKLIYDAGEGKKVMIKFLNFELEAQSGDGCLDSLKIINLQDTVVQQANMASNQSCTDTNTTVCVDYTCCDGNSTENCTVSTNATLTENCTCNTENTTQSVNCTETEGENSQLTTNQSCNEVNTTVCIDYTCCDGNSTENCTVSTNATLTDNCTCNTENTTQSLNCTETESSNSTTATTDQAADYTFCGSAVPSPIVSTGPKVKFRFTSNGANNYPGFKLLVTAFREAVNCNSNEFHCDTNRCIASNLKCDSVEHCVDGGDEAESADCSFLNVVVGYIFGLGNMTVIVIAIFVGVVIFSVVVSIIVYYLCCKKKNAVSPLPTTTVTDPSTSAQNTAQASGKGKKTVTVVAPAGKSGTPASNTRTKSKKRADDDDLW